MLSRFARDCELAYSSLCCLMKMKPRDIPTDIKVSLSFVAVLLLGFIPGLFVALQDLLLAKIFSTKPRDSIKDKDDGSSAPPACAECTPSASLPRHRPAAHSCRLPASPYAR